MGRAPMSIGWWIDKEDVVHIYNGILLSDEQEWNLAIDNNVDETGGYYDKQNKSEKNIWFHSWNLRNSASEHMGREGKIR